MVTYWICEIAGAPFVKGMAPFFDSVKDFVHLFYNRSITVDTVQLDYSFLVLAIILLIITWALKFVVEFIEDTEKNYDSIHQALKNKVQESFNVNLEQSNLNLEKKNNNFVFLIKFSAVDLAKDKFYTRETNDGTEEKQKAATVEFLELLPSTLLFEKKVLPDGILIFFRKVKNVDKMLKEITKTLESVRAQNKDEKWKINFLSGIETYSSEKDVINKCKILLMLVKLNLKNEILCLSTFKHRYSLLSNQQFFMESKGVYDINEEEDVFSVKNKEIKKKLI